MENSTDCHSAERFLFLEEDKHYGFPYTFSSDRSGNDTGLFTCEETPIIGGPFSPAMANYDPMPDRRAISQDTSMAVSIGDYILTPPPMESIFMNPA
ncbi:MAG: hypothetical protein ACOX5R_23035 [bacterium]